MSEREDAEPSSPTRARGAGVAGLPCPAGKSQIAEAEEAEAADEVVESDDQAVDVEALCRELAVESEVSLCRRLFRSFSVPGLCAESLCRVPVPNPCAESLCQIMGVGPIYRDLQERVRISTNQAPWPCLQAFTGWPGPGPRFACIIPAI